MKAQETIYLPPFPIVAKAKFGSPCNGCGWCCHEEICMVGKVMLKLVDDENMIPHHIKGPCPLMVFEDNKVRCGAVYAENEAMRLGNTPPGDTFAKMLGIGQGCCADDLQPEPTGGKS